MPGSHPQNSGSLRSVLAWTSSKEVDETKAPIPTVGAELLTLYQQLSPQQQDTLLNIAKVLKAADEPRVIGEA